MPKIIQWSCSIESIENFGADCGLFGTTRTRGSFIATSTQESSLTISANAMIVGVTYAFLLTTSSPDGRSASETVLVTPVSSGSTQVSITAPFTRFSAGSKLVISAAISADYPVTSVWSLYDSIGVPVPFVTLTSKMQSFSAADANNRILFPLSTGAGVLLDGTVYTFRFTSYPTGNPKLQTFTEIVLTSNSNPSGGYLSSTPSEGNALETKFLIASPGWTADVASFPLTYTFEYKQYAAASYLTLTTSSIRASTSSTLPSGVSSENSMVTLQAIATDIFTAFSTATTAVKVILRAGTNVTEILTSRLSSAFALNDVSLAFETVNNVSMNGELKCHIFKSNFFSLLDLTVASLDFSF